MKGFTPFQIEISSTGNGNASTNRISKKKRFLFGTAFTLIELMIVILIFSIILGAVFAVMTMGRTSWYTGNTQVEVQQEVRKGMDRMVKELRQSGLAYGPKYPGEIIGLADDGNFHNTITFRKSEGWDSDNERIDWGSQITYSLGGLNGKQLLRTSEGSTTILANKVVSLQFKRSSNIVEISLQAQKDTVQGRTMQSTLHSQVKLRN